MFDDSVQVSQKTEDLRLKLEQHLGVKAASFRQAVKKAGRGLPRRLRLHARHLIEAEDMASHPKLARRIDGTKIDGAVQEIATFLEAQDLSESRKTRRLNLIAGLALNLLVFGCLVLLFLRWRGLV